MPAVNHSANLFVTLVAALKGHAALVALIGAGAAARLFAGRAAQGSALPRVIFHEISVVEDYTHDSATAADSGLTHTIVQFDCEGRTATAARAVMDTINEVLGGATIAGARPGVAPANVQASFRESGGFGQDLAYDSGDGVAEGHRLSSSFKLIWRDTGYLRTPSGGYVLKPDGVSVFLTP